MSGERRKSDRGDVDRRKSPRWTLDRMLRWRVFRGRRIRESCMVERSLNGFVLRTAMPDAVAPGVRVFVDGGLGEINKLGFRSAVIKRTEFGDDSDRILFAEIEA